MNFAPQGLALSMVLFALGVVGVVVRRNLLFVLMSLEIMLNSAGLAFVSAAAMHSGARTSHLTQADGQVFFIFILPVAAAEVAIGLALAVLLFQRYRTLDLTEISKAKDELRA